MSWGKIYMSHSAA